MLAIRLFGSPSWRRDKGEWTIVPPVLQPLLGYLLLHRNIPLPRDIVAAALWPEVHDTVARAKLRRGLHRLRASLPPLSDPDWVLADNTTIQWQPQAAYWLDIAAFEQGSTSPDQLAEACDLYRGELLLGCYDDWVLHERERWRNLYLTNLELLIRKCRAERDYPRAISYASRLLSVEPLHETAVRLLMSVRYEAGDGAGATAEYQRFVSRLQAELDTPPMVDTTALYAAIRAGAPLPQPTAHLSLNPERASQPELPFVGRTSELATLEQAWVQAGQGRGSLVLVSGEAGIGKSRLATVASHTAERMGGRVLRGQSEIGITVPYHTVVTALRPVLPLLAASHANRTELETLLPLLPDLARYRPDLHPPASLEPAQERDRLYRALRACLSQLAASRPLLLIMEDLHLSDAATIDWLRFLSERLTTLPLLVVITYREAEVGRDHPLRNLRRSLPQATVHHLPLPRLDAVAVAALCDSLQLAEAGLEQRFYQESEGNPFILNELVANLADHRGGRAANRPTALMISMLIGDRLHRLQANTRLIAEAAAVVGSSFNVEVMLELTGRSEAEILAAIFELLDVNLLYEGLAGAYSFSHHLIQSAIYAALDPTVRSRRHRRLGQVLAELYPTEVDAMAATLARHCELGGDTALAISYYQRAAAYARSLYADEDALTALTAALSLTEEGSACFNLLLLREGILDRLGRREEQAAVLAELRRMVGEPGNARWERELLQREISFYHLTNRREIEATIISQLEAQAGDELHWQATAMLARAYYHFACGELPRAKELSEAAVGLYQMTDDRLGEVQAYCLQASCGVDMGYFDEVRHITAKALQRAGPNDQHLLGDILRRAALSANRQLQHQAGIHFGKEALTLAEATHDLVLEAYACNVLGSLSLNAGYYEDCLAQYQRARSLFANLGMQREEAWVLGNFAMVRARLGRSREALDAIQQVDAIFQQLGDINAQVVAAINLSHIANNQRWASEAQVAALHGLALVATTGSAFYHATLLCNLGTAELDLGDPAAVVHLAEAVALCRPLHNNTDLGEILPYLTAAYLADSQLEAATWLVAEMFEQSDYEVDEFFVHFLAACVERAAGNRLVVAAHLNQAYAGFQQKVSSAKAVFGGIADQQWHTYYEGKFFHSAILNAYERGVWPAWAKLPEGVTEEVLPACRYCQRSTAVQRAGSNGSGNQRYRCTACQRYFTVERKAHGHAEHLRQQARIMHREGKGIRAIARELAVSHRSVSNWLRIETES